jgi:hypothetical protein
LHGLETSPGNVWMSQCMSRGKKGANVAPAERGGRGDHPGIEESGENWLRFAKQSF